MRPLSAEDDTTLPVARKDLHGAVTHHTLQQAILALADAVPSLYEGNCETGIPAWPRDTVPDMTIRETDDGIALFLFPLKPGS